MSAEENEVKYFPATYRSQNRKIPDVQTFVGEWDLEGVYVYQAYCDEIADYAVANETLGGPNFRSQRMTWIKPSFAWMLYRSGYATKHGQRRILKVKLSHNAITYILSHCVCVDTNRATQSAVRTKSRKSHTKEADGDLSCGTGRVQWDPGRDITTPDGKVPQKLGGARAIQIGIQGQLSEYYVRNILSVEDVTGLAHQVRSAHQIKGRRQLQLRQAAMEELGSFLPLERPYMPCCSPDTLMALGMLPGDTADVLRRIGRGCVT